MKNRAAPVVLIFLLLGLTSAPAFADFIWPALVLEERMLSWWVIALGLLIEFLIVRRLFALTVKDAGIATLLANGVSTVAGIPLIPIVGLAWEYLISKISDWGDLQRGHGGGDVSAGLSPQYRHRGVRLQALV